jgi:hypothetical protein
MTTVAEFCAAHPDFTDLIGLIEQGAAKDPVETFVLADTLEAAADISAAILAAIPDDNERARTLLLEVLAVAIEEATSLDTTIQGLRLAVAHARQLVQQDYAPKKGEIT